MRNKLQFLICFSLSLLICSQNLFAQGKKVSGTIKDESGNVLPGATVMIEGTSKGVYSDIDGFYTIDAPAKGGSYTLGFYFVGMITQKIKVSEPGTIDVILKEENVLDGAVIVGAYGTKQSREDLVGSAFQINSDILKDKPKARLDNLLEGVIPGLTMEAANQGDASSTRDRLNVRIRGDGSLSGSNNPLWIIDGIPAYMGNNTGMMPGMSYTVSPLTFIDPNDIESITVLKDADQTTIYGANGSNGVILVTTKSGKYSDPLHISVTVNHGVSAPDYSTRFKMMNASQYLEVAREAWANAGYSMNDFPYQDNDYNSYSTTSTDWAKEYLGIGSDTYVSLNLSHGTQKAKTYISGSYYKNDNIVKTDAQKRFYIRINEKLQPWKGAELGISLGATYNFNHLFNSGRDYLDALPITSPYLNDGYTYRLYNKVWSQDQQDFVMKRFYDNTIPDRELSSLDETTVKSMFNSEFSWKFLNDFEIWANYGYNYTMNIEDSYSSRETLSGIDSTTGEKNGYSSKSDAAYADWALHGRLKYDKKLGRHNIMAYAGIEYHDEYYKLLSAYGKGFMNDRIRELAYADKTSISGSSSFNHSRSQSMFGRAEYSFDKRYYLSANVRRDGNSDFGIYARWSNFWSAGASWNIHNEPFFDVPLIKMLKLKFSYGNSGNSKVSSTANGTYNYGSSYAYMGISGGVLGQIPNPGLSWETTNMMNLGLRADIGGIFEVELEGYRNITHDLISNIYVSRAITDDKVPANVGRLLNQGIEMNLSSTNIKTKDFRWTTSFSISHNMNRILELYEGVPTSFGDTIWMEGKDRNTFALVKWAGVDPTDGSPMWYDLNDNITHTYNYSDRRFEKTSTPICFGGLINTFVYKDFRLTFQINYNIGGYMLSTFALNYFDDGYDIIGGNQAVEEYYYRWTTPGQTALLPRVQQTSNNQSSMKSTRYLYNKTSFTLSNASLEYTLPQSFAAKLNMKNASATLTGNNLYLFTPDQSRKFNSYKTMRNGYPVTRTITLGLNLSF